jgi:hypothetical protein
MLKKNFQKNSSPFSGEELFIRRCTSMLIIPSPKEHKEEEISIRLRGRSPSR